MKYVMTLLVLAILALPVGAAEGQAKQQEQQSQGEDAQKKQEQNQGEDCEKKQEQNQGEDGEKKQEQSQGEDGEAKQQQGRGGDPARHQHRHAEQNRYREREYDCPGCQAIADLPAGEVDEDEEADLVYTREEEKLARDVYRALFNEHRKKIFRKIARSEERHMAAVLVLLTKYEIEDPVGDNPEGTFVDAGLAALYSKFVTDGLKSVEDALAVGATIEEMDIVDLTAAKENADDADLILVYEYLLRGSRNHLRAFVRQLEKRDLTYTPQYLTQEEIDAIVSTPKETARKQNREARAVNRHRKRH